MTALLISLGLIVWPSAPPRLPTSVPRPDRRRWVPPISVGRLTAPLVGLGAATAVVIATGSATAGIAGAVLGTTLGRLARSTVHDRRRRRRQVATLQAVRALAREVSAGADLESAVADLRKSAGPEVAGLFTQLTTGAVDVVRTADEVGVALAAAFALSRRVGVPLSGLLDRLGESLGDAQQAAEHRAAAVAGARLSGWVLAGLPAMGVLLGAGMGADPIPVLMSGGLGGVLLVVGTTLTCVGLLWSARIARAPG